MSKRNILRCRQEINILEYIFLILKNLWFISAMKTLHGGKNANWNDKISQLKQIKDIFKIDDSTITFSKRRPDLF